MEFIKKSCLLGILALLCSIFTSNGPKYTISTYQNIISLEDAIKQNVVSCSFVSNGTYKGKCMDMQLKNLQPYALKVKLESGRNLESMDTNAQDIIIVEERILALNGKQSIKEKLYGFCSQSYNKAPQLGDKYVLGEMADKKTIKLTKYLQKNKFPISAMQGAIWSVVNNIPVEAIHNTERDSIKDLQNFVAELTYRATPWYSIEYFQNSQNLFTGNAKRIYGNINGYIGDKTEAKIVVYDMFEIPHIRQELYIEKEAYEHPISVNVASLPKGRYHVRVYTSGGRVDEKVINI